MSTLQISPDLSTDLGVENGSTVTLLVTGTATVGKDGSVSVDVSEVLPEPESEREDMMEGEEEGMPAPPAMVPGIAERAAMRAKA